jgi:hypothetical protein
MRTYVDIFFTAGGASPMEVARKIKKEVGISFVFGEHDFVIVWSEVSELHKKISELSKALRGMGVFFRYESHEETPSEPEIREYSWPPIMPRAPESRW